MKAYTKLDNYECVMCGIKQVPVVEQCPVLFTDVISPPVKCSCGSKDFDAHISQFIQLDSHVTSINVDIDLSTIKVNN